MYIREHCIDRKEYFSKLPKNYYFFRDFFLEFLIFLKCINNIRSFYKTLTIYVVYNNFIRVLPTK